MTTSQRRRNDPRREATREALIEAAEAMIARLGVEGVSLRQIGAAVGSLNKTVVTYHFGSRDALIEAVYRHRLPAFDTRRGELLEQTKAADRDRLEILMWVLWQPIFEQVNETGIHSYGRFLGNILRAGLAESREILKDDYPVTEKIMALIDDITPSDYGEVRQRRWALATNIVLDALLLIDLLPPIKLGEGQKYFDDAIVMAATGLMAPVLL